MRITLLTKRPSTEAVNITIGGLCVNGDGVMAEGGVIAKKAALLAAFLL